MSGAEVVQREWLMNSAGVRRSRGVEKPSEREKVFKDPLRVHQAEERGGHSRKEEQVHRGLQRGGLGEFQTGCHCRGERACGRPRDRMCHVGRGRVCEVWSSPARDTGPH